MRSVKTLRHNQVFCIHAVDNIIVSGSIDNTIKVWDRTTSACLATLTGHANSVSSVFVADTIIVSASADRTLKVWDRASYECLATLEGHFGYVTSCVVIDGIIVSGSADTTLKVWDRNTFKCIRTLTGHTKAVTSVIAIDNLIMSSSGDTTIKIWDRTSYACTATLTGHTREVKSIFANKDAIFSSSNYGLDGTVKIWDRASHACVATLSDSGCFFAQSVCAIDDMVISDGSESVRIWIRTSSSWTSFRKTPWLLQAPKILNSVLVVDNCIIGASNDGSITIWDRSCLQFGSVFGELTSCSPVKAVAAVDNVIIGTSKGKIINVWDRTSVDLTATLEGHKQNVTSLCVVRDYIISAAEDGIVHVWDRTSFQCIHTLTFKDHVTVCAADNAFITASNEIKVWDPKTLTSTQAIRCLWPSNITPLVFVQGDAIVTGYYNVLEVWDRVLLKRISRQESDDGWLQSVFAIDHIVLGSTDKSVVVWNRTTFDRIATLSCPPTGTAKKISANDKFIFVAAGNNGIAIWDRASFACVETLKLTSSMLTSMSVSEHLIICGTYDSTMEVWFCPQYTRAGKSCVDDGLGGASTGGCYRLIHPLPLPLPQSQRLKKTMLRSLHLPRYILHIPLFPTLFLTFASQLPRAPRRTSSKNSRRRSELKPSERSN